jgi:hypothetical protein
VAVPAVGPAGNDEALASVAAVTATDVWTVGRTCLPGAEAAFCRPTALHLVNGTWRVIPTGGGGSEFTEVVAFSANDVWVIGYVGYSPTAETDHAEHWDGTVLTTDDSIILPPGSANGEPASALSGAAADPVSHDLWAVGWLGNPVSSTTHAVHRI